MKCTLRLQGNVRDNGVPSNKILECTLRLQSKINGVYTTVAEQGRKQWGVHYGCRARRETMECTLRLQSEVNECTLRLQSKVRNNGVHTTVAEQCKKNWSAHYGCRAV